MIGPQGFIAIPQCLKRVQGLTDGANVQVKTGPGVLGKVIVANAGTASGTLYDAAPGDALNAANLIWVAPQTVDVYPLNMPFKRGLVWKPDASAGGQLVNLNYA